MILLAGIGSPLLSFISSNSCQLTAQSEILPVTHVQIVSIYRLGYIRLLCQTMPIQIYKYKNTQIQEIQKQPTDSPSRPSSAIVPLTNLIVQKVGGQGFRWPRNKEVGDHNN